MHQNKKNKSKMKKVKFMVIIAIMTLFCFSCGKQKTEKGIEVSVSDGVLIIEGDGESLSNALQKTIDELDSEKRSTEVKVFNARKAKLYFVQKWNTPSYYAEDGGWTGISHDGGAYLGVLDGDNVYFISESRNSRECFFPADGVSEDPRQTCWWLVNLPHEDCDFSSLENFAREATTLNKDFEEYIKQLTESISQEKGKNFKEQIINYTKKSVPGTPETWNAWEWPGYYGD